MDPRRAAVRVVSLALIVGLVAEALLDRHALGINLVVATGCLLFVAGFVRRPDRPLDPVHLWLPVAAVVFASFAALRADPPLLALDTIATLGLVAGSIAAAAGVPVTRSLLPRLIEVAGELFAAGVLGAIEPLRRGSLPSALGGLVRRSGPLAPVAPGLVIVLPLVAVFVPLFAAADPIFERIADQVLGFSLDLGDLPARGLFVAIVSWIAAGLLWIVAADSFREARSLGAAARTATTGWPRLGVVEAVTILIALDALFVVFVLLQVAYCSAARTRLRLRGCRTRSTLAGVSSSS
jgi:hypothetical protein